MNRFESISKELVQALELKYEPVGVSLFRSEEELPAGVSFFEGNLKSYCQAVALAGKGAAFLVRREQMGCKLGTSVLGFEEEMEAFLDDGVLEKYGVGLFGSEEASEQTMKQSFYLEKGKTRAALIAPLPVFQAVPQVVVFTANAEQIMWLLYALNYDKGGRMDLPQSGGALGGCADITALPLIQGIPNITFLGLGCRIKSAIDASHLMLGMPGGELDGICQHVRALAKPIAMLNKARAGA
ncbi:MAG: DUF169 domain-containing protein [Syntrophobacteraceae bacterium]